jgi:hypothetical protein
MKTLANTEDLGEIRGRIALLTAADVRLWGAMSCHQMVCHLTDAFGCPLGERAVAALKGPPIPVGVYRWLALWVPMKWPKGIKTTPEMDQRIGGTQPVEFAVDLAMLLRKLEQFAVAEGLLGTHPLFGVMTTAEWMRWGYLHTDHHLRQFGR